MRRIVALLALVVITTAALIAQPKVAVLDAQVPKTIDQSIVIPVTEKIIERLVVSGRYTVLDRANIEQVFKEREFQLTDIVSDQEAAAAAGKYLGADFVVVVKVQMVGDTYFLTSKLINISTGVIANQSSAESEGKLSSSSAWPRRWATYSPVPSCPAPSQPSLWNNPSLLNQPSPLNQQSLLFRPSQRHPGASPLHRWVG